MEENTNNVNGSGERREKHKTQENNTGDKVKGIIDGLDNGIDFTKKDTILVKLIEDKGLDSSYEYDRVLTEMKYQSFAKTYNLTFFTSPFYGVMVYFNDFDTFQNLGESEVIESIYSNNGLLYVATNISKEEEKKHMFDLTSTMIDKNSLSIYKESITLGNNGEYEGNIKLGMHDLFTKVNIDFGETGEILHFGDKSYAVGQNLNILTSDNQDYGSLNQGGNGINKNQNDILIYSLQKLLPIFTVKGFKKVRVIKINGKKYVSGKLKLTGNYYMYSLEEDNRFLRGEDKIKDVKIDNKGEVVLKSDLGKDGKVKDYIVTSEGEVILKSDSRERSEIGDYKITPEGKVILKDINYN